MDGEQSLIVSGAAMGQVLGLLDGEFTGTMGYPEKQMKAETTALQMPDLIDTSDPDGLYGKEDYKKTQRSIEELITPMTPIVDDIFGDSLSIGG